jgi:hypothetical protein
MRTPGIRGTRSRLLAAVLGIVIVGCAEAPASAPPTPRPTPVITPNPHLGDETTADAVFLALGAAGLRVTANNAAAGDGTLVKRINATYHGWPLIVSQYTSTAALRAETTWTADDRPGQGQPPIQIAGLNILVEWGPTTGAEPKSPSGPQRDGLRDLAGTLEALLSPIRARAVVPVPGAVALSEPAATDDDHADDEDEASPEP